MTELARGLRNWVVILVVFLAAQFLWYVIAGYRKSKRAKGVDPDGRSEAAGVPPATAAATWKRGLTRLYVVGWIAWVVLGLGMTLSETDRSRLGVNLLAIGGVCLLAPAVLLALLRWVFDGFTKETGKSGAPR